MSRPVTLITGTRKGIGRGLAEHFVGRGHRVVGCSRGAPEWELEGYQHHPVDVTDEKAALKLFAAIRRQHGRLDHLINNAGIATMNLALLTPMRSAREVMETNVLGSFLFCREAAKLMLPRKFGRIVNLTTVATPMRIEGQAIYAASKAAVTSLTEILARELGPTGITVNALGVAPTDTDLIRVLPRDNVDGVLARQALHRPCTLADIANAVEFFLRKESDYVTGQALYLGGP